jgi:hypothetical protein
MSGGMALLLQTSGAPVRPLHNKNGRPPGRPVIAPDRTELQTKFTPIGGIDGDCCQAQGDGDNRGDREEYGPHGKASSLAILRARSLAGKTHKPTFGSWAFLAPWNVVIN